MNKRQLQYFYRKRYIYLLNKIYDGYFNIVDNNVLLKEYNLLFDVMTSLVYDHNDTWYANFGGDKYKKTLIYQTNKEYWNALSNLFDQVKKYC